MKYFLIEISDANLPTFQDLSKFRSMQEKDPPLPSWPSLHLSSCHFKERQSGKKNASPPQVVKTPEQHNHTEQCLQNGKPHYSTLYKIVLLLFVQKVFLGFAECGGCPAVLWAISSVLLENYSRFFFLTHCNHMPQSAKFQQSFSLSVKVSLQIFKEVVTYQILLIPAD